MANTSSYLLLVFFLTWPYCDSERYLSNKGNKFVIGFLPPVISIDGVQLIYTTENVNTTTVSANISSGQQLSTTTIKKHVPAIKVFPYGTSPIQVMCTDDTEISVYASLRTQAKSEMTASYLCIPPHELLTRHYEYIILSVNTVESPDSYRAGVLLIGIQENTKINITLRETDSVEYFNSSVTTINEMETLFIRGNATYSLTGTRIVSDKPLTVVSGHEAGSVPSDGTSEPMAQQIPPTQLWGDTFMIVPMKECIFGQIIKVLSSVDNTEIVHYCHQFSNSSVVLPKAGSVHEFFVPSTVSCYIKANNSVLVGQFPYSPSSNNDGDTTMILVASIDQYSNEFNFWTSGVLNDYISVIVPVDYFNPNSILLDNVTLSDITWKPIYSDGQTLTIVGYGCGLSVSEGSHTIFHNDSDGRLFVMVYGFGLRRAHGYPAGLTFDSSKVLSLQFVKETYHFSPIIVQLLKTAMWSKHGEFTIALYNTMKIVQTIPVIIVQPNESIITVTFEQDKQLGIGQYFIDLCCTNQTLKDVCIHTTFNLTLGSPPDISTFSSSSISAITSTMISLTIATISSYTGTVSSNSHGLSSTLDSVSSSTSPIPHTDTVSPSTSASTPYTGTKASSTPYTTTQSSNTNQTPSNNMSSTTNAAYSTISVPSTESAVATISAIPSTSIPSTLSITNNISALKLSTVTFSPLAELSIVSTNINTSMLLSTPHYNPVISTMPNDSILQRQSGIATKVITQLNTTVIHSSSKLINQTGTGRSPDPGDLQEQSGLVNEFIIITLASVCAILLIFSFIVSIVVGISCYNKGKRSIKAEVTPRQANLRKSIELLNITAPPLEENDNIACPSNFVGYSTPPHHTTLDKENIGITSDEIEMVQERPNSVEAMPLEPMMETSFTSKEEIAEQDLSLNPHELTSEQRVSSNEVIYDAVVHLSLDDSSSAKIKETSFYDEATELVEEDKDITLVIDERERNKQQQQQQTRITEEDEGTCAQKAEEFETKDNKNE